MKYHMKYLGRKKCHLKAAVKAPSATEEEGAAEIGTMQHERSRRESLKKKTAKKMNDISYHERRIYICIEENRKKKKDAERRGKEKTRKWPHYFICRIWIKWRRRGYDTEKYLWKAGEEEESLQIPLKKKEGEEKAERAEAEGWLFYDTAEKRSWRNSCENETHMFSESLEEKRNVEISRRRKSENRREENLCALEENIYNLENIETQSYRLSKTWKKKRREEERKTNEYKKKEEKRHLYILKASDVIEKVSGWKLTELMPVVSVVCWNLSLICLLLSVIVIIPPERAV